jgi:hypothetical protein
MNSPLHKRKPSSKTRTTVLHKAFLAAGLLSGAACATLGLTPAAKAASFTLGTAPSSVDEGDKTYSNFSYTGFSAGDTVNIGSFGAVNPQHTLNLATSTGGWGVGTYVLNYKVTVKSPSLNYFDKYRTSLTSSLLGTNKAESTTTFSMLSMGGTVSPSSVMDDLVAPNSPTATFGGHVTSALFTNTLVVTEGGATLLDNTLVQKSPSTVPGPLPLLGAGAAFGFSRRIRSRIKASA